ncbi:MAG: phosphoglycerate dehydrogenase [Firmicutes bacterium]|nr:phosphoglycerate dehydrogenase [Bacillota bacterium]
MYNVQTLNKISEKGLQYLNPTTFAIADEMDNPDGIIVRSFEMKDMDLPESLLAIARAGAGTNNIPVNKCSEEGIVVFFAPGANANAVKELVLTSIFLSSRKVIEGIEWTKTLRGKTGVDKIVEKEKSQFAGPEIAGKTLGVIGLGAVGVRVVNAAIALGMTVIGYDPYLSIHAAWNLSGQAIKADSIESVVSQSDYVTIHMPLNDSTRGSINKEVFDKFKEGARLINLARGEIVDSEALKEALNSGKIAGYITDFPIDLIMDIDNENLIMIPHLGASTPESEENCAEMAAIEIRDYLEYGIIRNSVNFPDCTDPYTGGTRIGVLHKNVPGMLGTITNIMAKHGVNIENLANKNKGDWAYTLIDTASLNGKNEEVINEIKAIDCVVRARIVREK